MADQFFVFRGPFSQNSPALEETSVKLNPTGSILVAMYGATIGKVGVLTFPATTNQACCACIEYDGLEQMYLFYFLLSHRDEFIMQGGGGAQPNISREKIIATPIPVPPLAEQKRIIAEIEKWFSLIDTLEESQSDLETAIKQTKSKILDLAIHGKLVPQGPNDEPAIELLKRINPSFVPCDNAQYPNMPSNWFACNIKDVFQINPKTNVSEDVDAGFVPMSNICDQYNNTFTFETRSWSVIRRGYTHFKDGDIVVAKISPCLENRKSVVLQNLPNGIGAGTTELNVFRSNIVYPLFGLYFFKSEHFISNCVGTFNGVVGQQRVATKIVEEIDFFLPPYDEQLRIVAKIEELFAVLDEIQESIEA